MVSGFINLVMLVIRCDASVKKSVSQAIKDLDHSSKNFAIVVHETNAIDFRTIALGWRNKNTLDDSWCCQLIKIKQVTAHVENEPLEV